MVANNEALAQYEQGRRLLASRRFQEAAEAFRKSLLQQPKFVASAVGLGLCCLEMRDGHGMFESFKLALDLIGKDTPEAQVWLTLSKFYIELGYPAEAAEAHRRILNGNKAA